MKAQGLAVQAGLAVAGLAAALLVWQREPESAPGEVVVVEASRRSLSRVRYEDGARTSELVPGEEGLWVQVEQKAVPPVPAHPPLPDGGSVALPAPPAAPPPAPARLLRANEAAEQLLARFTPMRATRNLGVLDEKKQAELGLKASPRRLTLTVSGRPEAFSVSAAQPGLGSTYLRRESDGRVFVVAPALVTDLENAASRLVDRRLHAFEPEAFHTLEVKQGGAQRRFQVAGTPPVYTPEGAGQPDTFARNWHEKVWKLVPLELLGKGEAPQGALQPAFEVAYVEKGKQVGSLTLSRNGQGEYYARTEHTPGWVKLHGNAEALVSEAAKVATGK